MKPNDMTNATEAIHAEQSVIGALLIDNEALYRIPDLTAEHFYRHEHRAIFSEIRKQVASGKRCDVITVFDSLQGGLGGDVAYLNQMAQSIGSSAAISRYADMVVDRSLKRAIASIGGEMQEATMEPSGAVLDRFSSKLEALAQKKTHQEPKRISEMLSNYVETIQDRMDGKIKPIETGFADLDRRLDGGLERGTLTVVAARPGMGKTAFGLGVARNVSHEGSALFLSMEMSADQVSDRNVAALGKLPVAWLRRPSEASPADSDNWARMTAAFAKANEMNLFIDDQTGLNMLDIRSKARSVKRKSGLDVLVIDQLSFITGGVAEKSYEAVGEHTRGLLALAKELNIAVILLCQLNRKCEERPNKRPILSDLAMSGSIEQDAANVIFLYRDEVYNPDSPDKGVCEVNTAKQRQGEPGCIGLAYIGNQTRFDDLANWVRKESAPRPRSKGFE